jgi:hypothetical protein
MTSPDLKWILTQVHGKLKGFSIFKNPSSATSFLIAWFFCVVVSIFVARYVRCLDNASAVWFQVHRALNILALALMLIGLFSIFIAHEWRWLGPTVHSRNGSSTAWHTLFGVLSIGLGFTQPLNALFRCDPEHRRRVIFNWIHRVIGIGAWICAAICITIACRLFTKRFTNPNMAFALCLTIIIGTTLFALLMELVSRRKLSCILLKLFIVILSILVVALCLLIWLKRPV